MRHLLLAAALLMILCGCQTGAVAPRCSGSAFGLNAGRWTPTAEDMKACSQSTYSLPVTKK